MCYYVHVIIHVKDPYLSVVRVGHRVPTSVCSICVVNRDVNIHCNPNPKIIKRNLIYALDNYESAGETMETVV